jgi:hypothetical protein
MALFIESWNLHHYTDFIYLRLLDHQNLSLIFQQHIYRVPQNSLPQNYVPLVFVSTAYVFQPLDRTVPYPL